MQYRRFGRTGRDVSMLGFGAMRLPRGTGRGCDMEASAKLIRRGIDLGINYIDSAYLYIGGTSESAVGGAIAPYEREKLFIATKIKTVEEPDAAGDVWRAKMDESLARLDTPYIDMMMFHDLQWDMFSNHLSAPGCGLEVIRAAQADGRVRHVGFSSHDTPENIIRLIDTDEFDGMLVQYSLIDRRNEKAIARAAEAGLGVAVMGPLAGGRLGIPQQIAHGGGTEDINTPVTALRFVWDNPGVAVALSGMNVMDHVEENARAAGRETALEPEEREQIERLMERNSRLSDLYCTGCGYCMPCPNGVNIPENFRYMNWYRVWHMEKEARAAYASLGPGRRPFGPWVGWIEGLKAEDCVGCGECEPKCPQKIPIMTQLEETARTLGS